MNLHRRMTILLVPVLCVVSFYSALPAAADEKPPAAYLAHPPVYSATAGKSVPVRVSFADPGEIAEMRLYFKTMTAADYLFLPMTLAGGGTFTASLPPARNWTKGLDYLLLRKSVQGETRKTKPFRLLIQNDYNSAPPHPGELTVQSEHSTAGGENLEFAVPLQVAVTAEPLLAGATEDPYPPITVPGPGGSNAGKMFGGLGGASFSIKVGGISFTYRSFSGR